LKLIPKATFAGELQFETAFVVVLITA